MSRLLLLLVSMLAAAEFATATPTLRSITIPETPSTSTVQLCTDTELAAFSPTITSESNDCAAKATYDWNSDLLPSTTERQELCKCTKLIKKLQTITVPKCGFFRSGVFYSYKELTEFAFGLCVANGSSDSSTSASASEESRTPTAAISGGVVGVLAIAVVVAFVIRKRQRGERPRTDSEAASTQSPGGDLESCGRLSPLVEAGGSYVEMSPREHKKKGAAEYSH